MVPGALSLLLALAPLLAASSGALNAAQKEATPKTQELLRDGDFEKSGKAASPGWSHVWPQDYRPAPSFSFPDEGVRSGQRCAEIAVAYAGGYTSFTQELDLPRKTDWVRFSGWVQLAETTAGGSAWLILTFIKKDTSDFDLRQSRRVSAVGGWEELVLEAAVPEGTTRLIVRCGVFGPARVRFDDVSVIGGTGARPREDVTLLAIDSYWTATAHTLTGRPSIDVSVPFPFAAQTPLALRVDSEPPGVVRQLEVLAERENRPLRVHLAPLTPGTTVKLHVRTLVLVRRRELPDGEDIDLVPLARVPDELREYLQPAAGIESENGLIRRIAGTFRDRDLAEVTSDLFEFLKREIQGGGGDQGALATLESKDAACTGHANLGAALLIAAGVPTRVLACVMVGAVQQEHYVVESWTKALGWSRVETTLKLFPVPDALHAILRVVYTDSPRGEGNVPLFWRGSEGVVAATDGAALDKAGCWQAAKESAQIALERSAVETIVSSAREAFEARVESPHDGAWVRLVPPQTPAELLVAVERFLAP